MYIFTTKFGKRKCNNYVCYPKGMFYILDNITKVEYQNLKMIEETTQYGVKVIYRKYKENL